MTMNFLNRISAIRNIKKADLKTSSKGLFWTWIAYQSIKGTLTTAFIWVPLIWAWMH